MAEPFLSEIRMFAFNFPPRGWAFCNGQTLAISQNQALFALLGTTYGGNGVQTFLLPNLQGRAPMHQGPVNVLGTSQGENNHTLTITETPGHVHTLQAQNIAATVNSPLNANLAQPVANVGSAYSSGTPNATMAAQAVGNTGGSQPHNNMQPYLAISFCIALVGIFPSRN